MLAPYHARTAPAHPLATHYHTFQVHPYWDAGVNFIGQIGAHRFYRMQGPAGAPEACLAAYRGGEPTPGPHPRSSVVSARPDVAADPLVLHRAFAAGKVTVTQGFTPAAYVTHAAAQGGHGDAFVFDGVALGAWQVICWCAA